MFDKPFDGAISRYLEKEAPEAVRAAIGDGGKRDILDESYPYDRWLKKSDYEDELDQLQIELVKCQRWVRDSGASVWLLNTGWTGGSTSTGKRMPIAATRALLNAALAGQIDTGATRIDPLWGMAVPTGVPEAASSYMDPRATWDDPAAHDAAARDLRALLDRRLGEMGLRLPAPAAA